MTTLLTTTTEDDDAASSSPPTVAVLLAMNPSEAKKCLEIHKHDKGWLRKVESDCTASLKIEVTDSQLKLCKPLHNVTSDTNNTT